MSITELIIGWKDLEAAQPQYNAGEKYYEGGAAEVVANPRVRQVIQETGKAYMFNLSKTPVNVLANKLEITAVTGDSDQITSQIQTVWDANDLDVYLPDAITKMLEYGDSYVMVWEVEDDTITDGAPADAQADPALTAARMEWTVHNPKNCRMMYDPANERRKWFFLHRWCVQDAAGTHWRADLFFADRVERYVSIGDSNLSEATSWNPYTGTMDEPEEPELENPFKEIPAFHFRTELPYGRPVHVDAYGAQNAITKMLVTQITTTDHQGWPSRFALMSEGAELDQNNDDPDFPQEDDSLATPGRASRGGPQESQLKSEPGTLNYLPGVDNLVQLSPADPAAFLDPAEFYIRLMSQLTDIPMHHFDPNGEVPSGSSLKVKDAPLNNKAKKLQKITTGPVREAWLFTLKAIGTAAKTVTVNWAPVEVATGLEDWQVVQAKQASGVPQDQTLVEAGYDPEKVQKWLDDDAEAMDLMRRADLMDKVASALQKLSAAVSLGVVNAEQAQLVFAMLTGQKPEPVDGPPVPVDNSTQSGSTDNSTESGSGQ